MRLTELTGLKGSGADPEIAGLTADSRAVRPGWLFAALPGSKADGRQFIADAARAGASAILSLPGTPVPAGAVLVPDGNPRRALSLLAARFYGAQPETVVAVTGTNGKTSTAHFTQQIWNDLGARAVSIGTLGLCGGGMDKAGSLTTPDPVALHATMAELAKAGVNHLAMEASSHGLDQFRLEGVKLRAAGFTNITRDHLDYHKTMEDYFAAKSRLFTSVLPADGVAVLNADVPEFAGLSDLCRKRGQRVLSYGRAGSDLKLVSRTPLPEGQALTIEVLGRKYDVLFPVVGGFQAMNVLCAAGLVLAEDRFSADKVVGALAGLKGPPGRLQLVTGHPAGAAVYVDYAHTPDALETILDGLRPHVKGRLVCLVGCGGDRDPGKRPIMGRIAVEKADLAVITDDNPRTEDPARIRAAMMEGAKGAIEIGGRRDAIRWAVGQLDAGDILVLAGKGHEQGQIIGTKTEPFDDVEEAINAIESMKRERRA